MKNQSETGVVRQLCNDEGCEEEEYYEDEVPIRLPFTDWSNMQFPPLRLMRWRLPMLLEGETDEAGESEMETVVDADPDSSDEVRSDARAFLLPRLERSRLSGFLGARDVMRVRRVSSPLAERGRIVASARSADRAADREPQQSEQRSGVGRRIKMRF